MFDGVAKVVFKQKGQAHLLVVSTALGTLNEHGLKHDIILSKIVARVYNVEMISH